jgi:hypothetical protein
MEISELLSQPHHMNPGRVTTYLEGFAAQMASVGHTSLIISFYLGSAIHFVGGWKPEVLISPILTMTPAKHSEHTTANVLDIAARNGFREPIRHVLSASPTICNVSLRQACMNWSVDNW